MSDHTPWPLIAKYLAGECTADERLTMEWWLEETENRMLFEQVRNAWDLEKPAEIPAFDTSNALQRLHERIGITQDEVLQKEVRQRSWNATSWLAAACVLVMMCAGYFFIKEKNAEKAQPVMAYITERSSSDSITNIKLPDGSKVWLNTNSSITYPKTFAGDNREVKLEGEAFFKVTHNPAQPFIVRSKKVSTRVLGTSFNVKAYPNDVTASVSVATGKVEVSKETETGAPVRITQLTPRQQLVINTERDETYMNIVSTFDVGSWRREQLVFRNNTYKEVIARLEMQYDVSIDLRNAGLKSCRVMASFDEGAALNEILKLLSISNSFKYQIKGSRVTITGGLCR